LNKLERNMRFATRAIHAGQHPDPATGALMTPVYLTSTFAQEAPGKHQGFVYTRSHHPTRAALEANLAALEEGRHALAFASGMAAEAAVLQLLSPGEHVVCCQDLYGGTYRLLTKVFRRFQIDTAFVDAMSLESITQAIRENTRLIWLESPSNPLLKVCDIAAISRLAHDENIKVVVDNTFASPALQQPLKLGADIVVHSTTKYLNGHSDIVGGAVIVNDEKLLHGLKTLQSVMGAVPGPLDCFLALRGIKTLALRMREHCENALAIAEHLNRHAEVARVFYPGLKESCYRELAQKQMTGFGGMVSLELKGGAERALRFVSATKIFALAESLGGVESLIGYPLAMSHAAIPNELRDRTGISDSLVRLSVGIEDVVDLIEDLDNAIAASK
jgi:cystathionine gamma-lyase